MRTALLVVALLAALARPAAAYDPEARLPEDPPPDGQAQSEPEPQPDARPMPDADARARHEGLHRVDEIYTGARVTHSGDVTTYTTDTEHRLTDTYARAIDVVGTGQRSAFDGSAFNGRGSLSSGELLAGTYYENYVWTGEGFVPVNIVFFQDDSELQRQRDRAAPATSPLDREPPQRPEPIPIDVPGPGEPPGDREPPDRPLPGPTIEIGVDPTGGTALRDSLEVSRGRRYALTVNVRGVPPVALDAWQLQGGVDDATNAPGWHAASEPLAGMWLRLPAPGATWTLALRVRVHRVADGAAFEALGHVRIAVRAPAVVE